MESLEPRIVLAAEPVINEFMAANTSTLLDEDGQYSDWIELTNRGDAPLNLDGWFLTDNSGNLEKWRFPAEILDPGEYLVVFASGNNRAVAGQQLHTNFRLSADGEFLALVEPDGATLASAFSLTFPRQTDDVSYGTATLLSTNAFVQATADARVLVPNDGGLGTTWTATGFNDTAWQSAVTGVGYATTGPVSQQPGFTVRIVANGTTPGTTTGAAAIINGVGPFSTDASQVAANVNHGSGGSFAGDRAWPNGVADDSQNDFVTRATATVTIPAGTWTIGFGSDDGGYLRFGSLNFGATAGEDTGVAGDNEIRFEQPRGHAWTSGQITVPAGGITTTLDALMYENGGGDSFEIAIRSGLGDNAYVSAGSLLGDGVLGWQVKTQSAAPIPPFASLLQTNLQTQMYQQRSGAYLRVPFTLSDVPDLDTLTLRMKYDDAFVAYLNGVEIARSNVAAGTPAWNATATTDRGDANATTYQEFNVSGHIDELVEGVNVLSIHGLNASTAATDTGFLLLPELIGSQTLNTSLAYMDHPTPGAANVPGFVGLGAGPIFSTTTGTFSNNFNLTLSTADAGAVLRYTTNGAEPTETSPIYTGPIAITSTMQVRARSFPAGFLPSEIVSHTFYKLDADVQNFTSNLPIVVIDNFGQGAVGGSTLQSGFMAIFEPGEGGRTAIVDAPTTISRTGMKTRGSSTAGDPKHQYKLETWDDLDRDKNVSILGMPAESDWVLFASYSFDRALMRNDLIYELSNEMGTYAVRRRFVEVFLNTSGGTVSNADYIGVYSFMESVKRDDDRVDVDQLLPGDLTPPDVTGGYMVKIDRCDPGDSGFGAGGQGMCFVDPSESEIEQPARDAQEQYIVNYINTFATALNGANFANPTTGYAAYFDVGPSIDHHILNVLAMNVDALRLSTFLYKPRGGKLTFGPVWDFDRSMESYDGRDDNPLQWNGPPDSTIYFTSDSRNIWWGRLFQDPNFWQAWIDRWQELRESTLSTAHIAGTIDGFAGELSEAAVRNFTRWSSAPPRAGGFPAEVTNLKNWLTSRVAWIDGRFTRKPAFAAPSGTVPQGFQTTLSGPAGAAIYYTLDGSDPRASGGGISPSAILYTGAITINDNTRVTARAKSTVQIDGSTWSGPATNDYLTDPKPLAVSEIHFHPAAPTAAEIAAGYASADDFEFIEVQNVRNRNLNLAGYRFTSGIQFTFGSVTLAPGERAVVARNAAAFHARYGAGVVIAGTYGNGDPLLDTQLDNGGEPIVLAGPFGNVVQEFAYSDSWYELTDGLGFSLVAVNASNTAANWSDRASWRPSDFEGGSPRSGDTAIAPVDGSLVINEALTSTALAAGDMIEIRNTTATPIDLRHWYVTDDSLNVRKFQINSTAIVPAGGYLVLDKTKLGAAFSLSDFGGRLILQAANASNQLTGFRASIAYEGAAAGTTLGRHVNSEGDVDFVTYTTNTLGADNGSPVIGPVIINEIMYHPAAGIDPLVEDEYVELYNAGAIDMPLFDPAHPENTWRVTGIGAFAFPTGAVIPAGGYVVITSTDPGLFRILYAVPEDAAIYTFSGGLDNAGEAVKLYRPAAPQGLGVPYVIVDQVDYDDMLPWPELPDGNGPSLSRFSTSDYGNEPNNWLPSTLGGTPGRANTYHDTSPPSVPANLQRTLVSATQVDLAWNPSVDAQSGVLRYHVYRNGELVGVSTTTQFSDTTVAANTSYIYEVSALNIDLAESARSAPTAPLSIMAIVSAVAPREHLLRVVFSETVTAASAEALSNYSIPGVRIVGASLGADQKTVVLTTSAIGDGPSYTLHVDDVVGASGNELAPNSSAAFVLSGIREEFFVRQVAKASGQVTNLADADALLALAAGNAGIASEATVHAAYLDYKDDDGAADGGRFNGNAPFPNNHPGDDNDFAVRASGTIAISPEQAGVWTFAAGMIGPQLTLIPQGATWRFLDNGSDQGTAWRQPAFNDTAWKSGAAELGYGEGDEATLVDFGSDTANKYITTYFRRHFNVANAASVVALTLRLKRDDGAAIYLNGTEVLRDNLAAAAAYNTSAPAAASDDGQTFATFSLPANLLVNGDNVIAVEIHQNGGGSSDVSFDLSLVADTELAPTSPTGQVIFPRRSIWKFLDNGTNQGQPANGTSWFGHPNFNDAAWASGPAELGYGDGGEATVVGFGGNTSNRYATTYFRTSFNVVNPGQYSALKFKIRRDDGVAVYLNGVEVVRDGLAAGAAFNAFATITVGGADEDTYFEYSVDPSRLASGTNIIAAEVHQVNATSSDLSFDLEIEATGALSDDGARLLIDGLPVFSADGGVSRINRYGTANLTAGEHTVDLVYFDRNGPSQLELFAARGNFTAFDGSFRRVGDLSAGGLPVASPGTPPNDAPFVVDVLAASSQWSPAYLGALHAAGLGDGGISLFRGAAQLAPLASTNIDQLKIVFSDDMLVSQSDLRLWGVGVADYVASVGFAPGGFHYDAATRTATWTLAQMIGADKLLVDLQDTATDALGAALDGEWINAASRYSGNGTAGGDFRFRFNVLPGDVDGSSQVSSADVQANRQRQFRGIGDGQYVAAQDIDGSGEINVLDLVNVRDRQGGALPGGEPTAPASPGASAAAALLVAVTRQSAHQAVDAPAGLTPRPALSAHSRRTTNLSAIAVDLIAAEGARPQAIDASREMLNLRTVRRTARPAQNTASDHRASDRDNALLTWLSAETN